MEQDINIPFTKENRFDLIDFFIKKTNATTYLEIGCDKNQVFDKIHGVSKIGVDPVSGGTHRMTSDQFFSVSKDKFDVIFIDGLHHYDQVSRDIENAIKFLNDNGAIIIHDMLPINIKEANMPGPFKKSNWLGDVWRVTFDLCSRSDINFKLVLIDHGCGVITKTTQESKIFNCKNSWKWYEKNWQKLPLITYKEITE